MGLMLFSSDTESGVEDKKPVTQSLVNGTGAAYQKCSSFKDKTGRVIRQIYP
jgi:hypothetical protein